MRKEYEKNAPRKLKDVFEFFFPKLFLRGRINKLFAIHWVFTRDSTGKYVLEENSYA